MLRGPMTRDPSYLAECRALARAVERHPSLEALHAAPEWGDLERRLRVVLRTVHRFTPSAAVAPPLQAGRVRLVQWNIEHGNWYGQVERALAEHSDLAHADVLTLDEVDLGCARSGNRDVTAEARRTSRPARGVRAALPRDHGRAR